MTNRFSVGACVIVFIAFSVLCIANKAPLIEQDVATRCREALAANHIRADGLSVAGRDVTLIGRDGSATVTPQIRLLLERVPGVRTVSTQLITNAPVAIPDFSKRYESTSPQVRALQDSINAALQTQAIEFKPNSATLAPQSQGVLNAIAPLLSQAPGIRCEIRAYTRASADEQREWMVTLQRALATEDYLVSKGIADWRLSAQVFRTPNTVNGTPENRQIQLVVRER